jgi:hypothetical protein
VVGTTVVGASVVGATVAGSVVVGSGAAVVAADAAVLERGAVVLATEAPATEAVGGVVDPAALTFVFGLLPALAAPTSKTSNAAGIHTRFRFHHARVGERPDRGGNVVATGGGSADCLGA